MPLSLSDFWKRLVQSGLADSSQPRLWAAEFADEHDAAPPSAPLPLAKWLVKSGKLLPFQAACLIHGSRDERDSKSQNPSGRFPVMRIAPLTQSAERSPGPFEKWLPVAHDAHRETAGIVLQIVPTQLTPVDGDRLRVIAGIRGEGVPAYELLALAGAPLGERMTTIALDRSLDAVGLFAPLPPGQTLAAICTTRQGQQPLSAPEIVGVLQSLVGTLTCYCQTGGSLPFPPLPGLDRIWVPEDPPESPMLWLDPAEYVSENALNCTQAITMTESRLLYAAPETLDQSKKSDSGGSPASSLESQSVYALGCLGYRLRFGQHAFAAAKDEQIRSRQLHFEAPELKAAVAQGAKGDPLLRVLAYAVAKDPASRFATLDAFLQALRAAVPETVPLAADPAKAVPEAAISASETAKPASETTRPASKTIRPEAEATKPTTAKPPPQATPEPAAAKVATPNTVPPERSTSPDESSSVAAPASRPPAGPGRQASAPPPKATAQAATAAPTPVPSLPAEQGQAPPQETRDSAASSTVGAARRSRRRIAWYVLGSLWIPIALLVIALALQDPNASRPVAKRMRPPIPKVIPKVSGTRRPAPQPTSPRRPPPAPTGDTPAGGAQPTGMEVVSDDRMLWAPPSALLDPPPGESNAKRSTILLPPGPAAILTFDIPHLIATGLRDTFDHEVAPLFEQLQKRTSLSPNDIRMVAMAWFPGRDGIPEVAFAVHLKTPRPLDELVETWEVSLAQAPGGVTLYASDDPDGDAYYPHFADSASNSTPQSGGMSPARDDALVDAFAVGSIAQVTEVAEVKGAAVLLPRQLEELWQSAQPNDAVTMLTQPNFLIADARTWVDHIAPALRPWIRSTLLPECGGLLIRVAAAPAPESGAGAEELTAGSRGSYLEVRLVTAPGMDPQALKKKVAERVANAQLTAEDFLVSRQIDPSWLLLATRLPNMWSFLAEQTRSAAIRREVVFNAYLPPLALPQVGLGTLLASNTTAQSSAAMAANAPAKKLTLEEMLDRPMTVSFQQESLQFAIDTIVTEFAAGLPEGNEAPKVEIIGGDLQLMGITQNQQVRDFEKTDLPMRQVLTDLMLGANPDRTATGPDDPKQALIWVVTGDGDKAEVKITTREAAKNKNYTLPKEFQIKP